MFNTIGQLFEQVKNKVIINRSNKKVGRRNHFMALRHNVRTRLRKLFHVLKPTEYFVLELIADDTINWKAKYRDFYLDDMCQTAQIRMDSLRSALKKLEALGLITRVVHPRLKHTETICLNEEYFGQVLINSQSQKDRSHTKKHLAHLVNKPEHCENNANDVSTLPPFVAKTNPTHLGKTVSQLPKFTGEMQPSICSSYIIPLDKSSRPKSEPKKENFTAIGKKEKNSQQCADPIEERDRQLRQAANLGIWDTLNERWQN